MIGFVTGLGRCGTTMVMQMLDAGGVPVAGPPPSYEDRHLRPAYTDVQWLYRREGHVLKWTDPTATFVPAVHHGPIVWMDRDPEQQARSQLKLLSLGGHGPGFSRRERRAWVASVRADRTRGLAMARRRGDVKILRFEDVLRDPAGAADALARAFDAFGHLDVHRAAAMVESRTPDCAPDLRKEETG